MMFGRQYCLHVAVFAVCSVCQLWLYAKVVIAMHAAQWPAQVLCETCTLVGSLCWRYMHVQLEALQLEALQAMQSVACMSLLYLV
jgi:hypothetical protein